MSETPTCDPDEMKRQQYNPEFIAHVKEGHAQQVELTAESLMVLAHQLGENGRSLSGLLPSLGLLDATVEIVGPQGADVTKAIPVLTRSVHRMVHSLAVCMIAQATLATELARMKLKEIKVE